MKHKNKLEISRFLSQKNNTFCKNTLGSILTIGKFDAVHIGHKNLIQSIILESKKTKLTPIVIIVEPHPVEFFEKKKSIRLLTLKSKIKLISKLGIKNIVIFRFNTQTANLSPEDFIQRVLLTSCNCKNLIIGENFRFGKNQQGGIGTLKNHESKFKTSTYKLIGLNQENKKLLVDSSSIKKALVRGEINLANKMLGYEYFLQGKIIKGYARGAKMGFRTANMHISIKIALAGVYCGVAILDEKKYFVVANIGNNPTFENCSKSVELHFINKDMGCIYNKVVKFTPICFIRVEIKYENLSQLKSQITKDIEISLAILKQPNSK